MVGSLVVERDDAVIATLEGQRYGAILAHLARRPWRAISRDLLLGRHWPEVAEGVARNRLSAALGVHRKMLGDEGADIIVSDRSCVAHDPTRVSTAAQRFELTCVAARRATDWATRREALGQAA